MTQQPTFPEKKTFSADDGAFMYGKAAEDRLSATVGRIGGLHRAAMEAAAQRQDQLTKPRGSLGRLEELSVQLAGIYGVEVPPLPQYKAVIVMAGDHGVESEGVSLYPKEVTPQMVYNFVAGGAGINVLARHAGARVVVVDIGVASELQPHPQIVAKKIALGTRNMASGPAMSRDETLAALCVGIDIACEQVEQGAAIIATGDMGIANTTPSAALTAVITGRPVAEVTGKGTGIDDEALRRKVQVIERAIAVNRPDPSDPIDVLSKVGGLEIAGLAGVVLGAAASRVPVIIDGFISGAAALVAHSICPQVTDFVIAAHRSVEAGHRAALDHLGLKPLLDLELRLGEGTGGALAINIVEASIKILSEMATFAEAGVSEEKG